MTRIFGLDPGEKTGWALYEKTSDGERVVCHGVIAVDNPSQASEATILTTTRSYVRALLQRYMLEGVAVVAIEAPIKNPRFTNWLTLKILGVCEEAVASLGLTRYEVTSSSAKKAMGVKMGRPKKGEPPLTCSSKNMVKAAVEARFGLTGLSYHEADAIACAATLAKEIL